MDIHSRIKPVNPYHNIDEWYGPYDSLAHADASIPQAMRSIGMTVGIKSPDYATTSTIKEYWYNGGISSRHLVEKFKTEAPPPASPSTKIVDFVAPDQYILTNDINDIIATSSVPAAPYPSIVLKTKSDSGLPNQIPTESRFVTITISSGSKNILVNSRSYAGGTTLLCSYDHDKGKWTVTIAKEKEADKEYSYETYMRLSKEPAKYDMVGEVSPGYWKLMITGLLEGDIILNKKNDSSGGLYHVSSVVSGGGMADDEVLLKKILPVESVSTVEYSGKRYYNVGNGEFMEIPDVSSLSIGNTTSTSAVFVATYGDDTNVGVDIIKPVATIKKAIEVASLRNMRNVVCIDYAGTEEDVQIPASIDKLYAPLATIRSLMIDGSCDVTLNVIQSKGRDGMAGFPSFRPAIESATPGAKINITCNVVSDEDSVSDGNPTKPLIFIGSMSEFILNCDNIKSQTRAAIMYQAAASTASIKTGVISSTMSGILCKADPGAKIDIHAGSIDFSPSPDHGGIIRGEGTYCIYTGLISAHKICSTESLASTYINYNKGDIVEDQSSQMAWNNHKVHAGGGGGGTPTPQYIVDYVDKMISREKTDKAPAEITGSINVSLLKNRVDTFATTIAGGVIPIAIDKYPSYDCATLLRISNQSPSDIKIAIPSSAGNYFPSTPGALPVTYSFRNMTGSNVVSVKSQSVAEIMFVCSDITPAGITSATILEIRVTFKHQL